jgi:hypothetical protein
MPQAPAGKEPHVNLVRDVLPAAAFVCVMALVGLWLSAESFAQAQGQAQTPILGAWSLNKDLSDQPPSQSSSNDSGNRNGGGTGRRGGGGGYGGGFGGGMRGGHRGGGMGQGQGNSGMSPEDQQRMREAMRDEMTAPDHLTIIQTEKTIVITTQDGRTTRLSPDGKKVKDDNTKIERKTKWDSGKLVSEINGLGPSKITETYLFDPDTHHLRVTIHTDAKGNRPEMNMTRVYEADANR